MEYGVISRKSQILRHASSLYRVAPTTLFIIATIITGQPRMVNLEAAGELSTPVATANLSALMDMRGNPAGRQPPSLARGYDEARFQQLQQDMT